MKNRARGSILVASVSKAGRLAVMPVPRFFIRVTLRCDRSASRRSAERRPVQVRRPAASS